jgi:aerobic-type carbon monoxide dehydrogenase small subunit (CoxS/CutS family)
VLSAYALVQEGRELDEITIRDELAGNLCRCTGYEGIVDAVLDVSQEVRP